MIDSLRVRDYCYFSGDGRCDSPGHSIKYLAYSVLGQATNTIVLMHVTQVIEAGSFSNMDKLGFIKTMNNLRGKKVKIKTITTDQHSQTREYTHE